MLYIDQRLHCIIGVALQTRFTLECPGWIQGSVPDQSDTPVPLIYTIHSGSGIQTQIIYSGTSYSVSPFTLNPPVGATTQAVIIEIGDAYGSVTNMTLSVEVIYYLIFTIITVTFN